MYNPTCRLPGTGSTQQVNYVDADQNTGSKTAFSSQMPTPFNQVYKWKMTTTKDSLVLTRKSCLLLLTLLSTWTLTASFQPFSTVKSIANHGRADTKILLPFQRKVQVANALEVVTPDNEATKKLQMTKAYNVCSIILGVTSTVILFMTDKTQNRLLGKKVAGAVGFALASGVSYILAGANDHGRLGSDTYKRLNIGLFGFSSLGLLGLPGEAGFLPNFESFVVVLSAMTVVKVFVGIVAFKGWKRGISSQTSMLIELFEGSRSTAKGLWFTKKRGAAYRNPLLLVIAGLFSSFFEACFFLNNKMPVLDTSLWWAAIGRLFLITTMMYSLKDAAERERLAGTTFIQLNFMMFMWLFTVGIAQGLSVDEPFMLTKASLLPLSIPFLIETGRYQTEKNNNDKATKK